MTGEERAQAAKAMAKAKITEAIPPNASARDVVDIIIRQFTKNQEIGYAKLRAQGRL